MSRVDPYTQRYPTNVPLLNSSGTMSKEWIDWYNFDNLWKQQIWQRTGGGSDLLSEIEQLTVSQGTKIARNSARIMALEEVKFTIILTDADITTGPYEEIICNNTSSINVTLDTEPVTGDRVIIKRSDAEVEVIGQIDGDTNKTINVQYYSMKLLFNGTEWIETS